VGLQRLGTPSTCLQTMEKYKRAEGKGVVLKEDVIAFIWRIDLDVSSMVMFYSVTWNSTKWQN